MAVPIAFLALFFAWPLVAILRRSLVVDGRLDVPWGVVTSGLTRQVLWFTLWQATVSTALTLAAGLPLAWALSRFRFRGRSVVEAFVLVPFVLPTVVVATAFIALLPDGVERSVWAILLAHVFFNVAVVVRVVGAFWSGLDRRLWDAAATLGASGGQRRLRLTLPLLAPALASAASIVFLFCFTSFGVIVILGGPGYATLESEIYNQAARLFDLRTAAVLGLIQLAAVAATVLVSGRLERRLGGPRRGGREAPRPTGRERIAVGAVVLCSVALLALPLLALIVRSLQVGDGYGFDHFTALAHETPALFVAPWHAVVNSLLFATAAAAIALAVGIPAAVAVAGGRRGLDVLLMLPLGASAALLGFGFLLAFADPPLDLRSSHCRSSCARSSRLFGPWTSASGRPPRSSAPRPVRYDARSSSRFSRGRSRSRRAWPSPSRSASSARRSSSSAPTGPPCPWRSSVSSAVRGRTTSGPRWHSASS